MKKIFQSLIFAWRVFRVRHFRWQESAWDLMMTIRVCVVELYFKMLFEFVNTDSPKLFFVKMLRDLLFMIRGVLLRSLRELLSRLAIRCMTES